MTVTRVLIVDDSATVRAVLRRVLTSGKHIEVVGEAEDGLSAIHLALELKPDAIVMDLDLPGVDGITATEEIYRKRPTPVLVVTSKLAGREEILRAFGTLRRGVVGIFPKPRTPGRWEELGAALVETVQQLRVIEPPMSVTDNASVPGGIERPSLRRTVRLLAIGASTGGPGAICELLRHLGRPVQPAVCVIQHIAEGFDQGLAEWLAHELKLDVRLVEEGESLTEGKIRIAPADRTLRIDEQGFYRLETSSSEAYSPSIDTVFGSLVAWRPTQVAAVLLSGMGRDGVTGLLALREAGALTIVQNEESSSVFGMPKVALKEGAAELAMNPEAIGRLIRSITEEVSA
ncbi:MAG: response regulator [bacterium]|nr:response regulator [bacterium]